MIYETIKKIGIPARYSHFDKKQAPPFLVWLGDGQDHLSGDDTAYWRNEVYSVEYVFKDKSPELEAAIENTLLADGYRYTKSEDAFIESEGVFSIYYTVR